MILKIDRGSSGKHGEIKRSSPQEERKLAIFHERKGIIVKPAQCEECFVLEVWLVNIRSTHKFVMHMHQILDEKKKETATKSPIFAFTRSFVFICHACGNIFLNGSRRQAMTIRVINKALWFTAKMWQAVSLSVYHFYLGKHRFVIIHTAIEKILINVLIYFWMADPRARAQHKRY